VQGLQAHPQNVFDFVKFWAKSVKTFTKSLKIWANTLKIRAKNGAQRVLI